jgi:hypothetical protein
VFFVFALAERKNEKQIKTNTMLPQAWSIDMGKCVTPKALRASSENISRIGSGYVGLKGWNISGMIITLQVP